MSQPADVNIQPSVGMFTFLWHFMFLILILYHVCCCAEFCILFHFSYYQRC